MLLINLNTKISFEVYKQQHTRSANTFILIQPNENEIETEISKSTNVNNTQIQKLKRHQSIVENYSSSKQQQKVVRN